MIHYSVGNKWDLEFLKCIIELNSIHKNNNSCVHELYGSLHSSLTGIPSARPDFRLPAVSLEVMADYIAHAHAAGIQINYTINSPLSQSVEQLNSKRKQISETIGLLSQSGVDTFTISNSLLFEIVRDSTQAKLEVSSILPKRSVAQLRTYKDWGATTICMDVACNRDISFLMNYTRAAKILDLDIRLLVNELCSIAGAPCNGLYQNDCVMHSTLGGNPMHYFSGWPFSRCSTSRSKEPSDWLKAPFILPQWVDDYKNNVGVTSYKITGRTCDTNWLLKVVDAYLGKKYCGDIRNLWVDPWNKECSSDRNINFLQADYLQKYDFIKHWWNNPNFRCDEHCGITCSYCNSFANIG